MSLVPRTAQTRRDWLLTGIPLVLLALLMAHHGHLPGGVILGGCLVLAATVGILGLLGDSPLDLRGDEQTASPDARPWWRREGSLVVAFGALLYVPTAGVYGLWDPWETHYSEVAREILSRDDWITTWWAQEGWFMSKPILIFWMSALGMGAGSLFGVHYQADAGPNQQEWFIRLPIVALAIAALFAVYRAVANAWGVRAGALAALVLATMPQWFFLAHQAMTDMPFVASLTLAVAMFTLAVTSSENENCVPRRFQLPGRAVRVSLWHLTLGLGLVTVLPQVVYLLTRPVFMACPGDAASQCSRLLIANRLGPIQFPVEMFYSGSWGNSGVGGAPSVPGSPPWERVASAVPFFPSYVQGLFWTTLGGVCLRALRFERRKQAMYYVLFYFWCAISTMGKGPAGVAIPGAIALLHLLSTGRWRELQRIQFPVGVLVFLLVGMPWYVAIYGRLGDEFIQRFIVHDIINRTMVGVHGDTGSVRYFLWQLGYATFPWCGLIPAALLSWPLIIRSDTTSTQRDVARIGMFWFASSFVLFSAMVTKFHHYIFPALPGAAIIVGLLLHRMLGEKSPVGTPSAEGQPYRDPPVVDVAESSAPPWVISGVALAIGTVLIIVGAARWVGSLSGILTANGPPAANIPLGIFLFVGGMGACAVGAWLARSRLDEGRVTRLDAQRMAGAGALAIGAAMVVAFVARDLVNSTTNPPGSERLIHLFVYNYDRPWPTRFLDFRGPLFGVSVAAVLTLVGMAWRRTRAVSTVGLLMVAACFAVWSLNVYMIDVTPHWSQRGLIDQYYHLRQPRTPGEGEDAQYRFDPLIAHQMNWKGENFYTGNHVIAMECGLTYCSDRTNAWIARHHGWRVFIITEHARAAGLLSTLHTGGGDGRLLTTERDDNKFVLIEAHIGSGTRPSSVPEARSQPGVANSQ